MNSKVFDGDLPRGKRSVTLRTLKLVVASVYHSMLHQGLSGFKFLLAYAARETQLLVRLHVKSEGVIAEAGLLAYFTHILGFGFVWQVCAKVSIGVFPNKHVCFTAHCTGVSALLILGYFFQKLDRYLVLRVDNTMPAKLSPGFECLVARLTLKRSFMNFCMQN